MLSFITGFLLLLALAAWWALVVARRAPEGYEDASGFHAGPDARLGRRDP